MAPFLAPQYDNKPHTPTKCQEIILMRNTSYISWSLSEEH